MERKNLKHKLKSYSIWTVILLIIVAALYFAAKELVPDDWFATHGKDWFIDHGVRILLIIVFSTLLYLALRKAIPHAMQITMGKGKWSSKAKEEQAKRTKTLSKVFVVTSGILILVIALFMILSELGVNIGPLIAGFGIVGVAVGFGAQYLIRDLIAGLFIIMENQYNVGDVVRIGSISGVVEEINMRRTVMRDLDGIVHFIPNGESGIISNFTKEWSRVNLNISVSYGTDLDHAIAVINRVCKEMAEEPLWKPSIIKAPQVLRVDNLGDSGIDLKILGDTKPIMQWDVMGEIRKRIKRAFDDEGIEIPWPHMKVYFGDTKPDATKQ
ncbi:MAG: mechanosensitive ion channel family protein [Dehalococcoidia bacterium]